MQLTNSVRTSRGVPAETLDDIRQFDTCTIANAIEGFGVRLRNEGFTLPGLRPVTEPFPRLLGYAATWRVRSGEPPMTGNAYAERTDWYGEIERLAKPRVAVIQDLDNGRGLGSSVGEVHAAILKAFGCGGVISDGAVRDVPAVAAMGFPMFARTVSVSHSYAHVVDYGKPVKIFGLEIRPGDLVYADCHGVVSIPLEIAADVPRRAAEIRARERRILDLCRSPEFSAERLRTALRGDS